MLAVLERMLTSLGFGVITAQDGEQALSLLAGNRVDVILCDIRMPGLGGPELYEAVAAHTPWLAEKMIFCTGDTLLPDAQGFLRRTRCRVVSKPFSMEQLTQALTEVRGDTVQSDAGGGRTDDRRGGECR